MQIQTTRMKTNGLISLTANRCIRRVHIRPFHAVQQKCFYKILHICPTKRRCLVLQRLPYYSLLYSCSCSLLRYSILSYLKGEKPFSCESSDVYAQHTWTVNFSLNSSVWKHPSQHKFFKPARVSILGRRMRQHERAETSHRKLLLCAWVGDVEDG